MRKNRLFLLFLFLSLTLGIYSLSYIWAQEELKPIETKIPQPDETPIVSTTGRLALEKHEEEEWLILHAKDAKTYLIKGGFAEKLKSLFLELGVDNLITATGKQDGSFNLLCKNIYKFDSKGNNIIETICIRYHHLEVIQIIEAKKSAEEIPPPERDSKEEAKTRALALSFLHRQATPQVREIEGKIISLNLRAPIKTVEVRFRDKDGQSIDKTLLIGSNTRIAKKKLDDNKEPMFLSLNSLKVGQEVFVVYSRDEFKAEALFITITKE